MLARRHRLEEIAANGYNLNIALYVEPKPGQKVLSIEDAMQRLQASAQATFTSENKLIDILKREGLLA